MIEKKTVIEVAALARLELTDTEVERMAVDLAKITAHIDRLANAGMLDIAHALDDAHPEVAVAALRDDVARDGLRQEEFLVNAPAQEAGYLKLPKVVE